METEYIKVEVARSEFTDIYLKVPKGWRPKGKDYKLIGQAANETTQDYDWDNYGWENDVEVLGYALSSQDEAEEFKVFDATAILV
jgi:hypothetical protein